MSFWIVLKGGRRLNYKIIAPDADVAVYKAQRLGFRHVSHAVAA